MSIDVFGHVLDHKNGGIGARGPPGEGFQRTPGGDFDINHKRLCNIAAPQGDLDAVNFVTLHELLQTKSSLDEVKGMIESLRDKTDEAIKHLEADLDGVKSLALRNAALIRRLADEAVGHV